MSTSAPEKRNLPMGKKSKTYDSRDLQYENLRGSATNVVQVPVSWGRGMDFSNWGMAGNGPIDPGDNSIPADWPAAANGCGDCTIADPTHCEKMNAHDAGAPVPPISAMTSVKNYSYVTGKANGAAYNPQTGENDTGLEIRDVLNYRVNEGLFDDNDIRYKIGIYLALEVGNWASLQEACWLFPGVSFGMDMTQAQMDQFNNNQVWRYVAGSPTIGGHCIPCVGRPYPGAFTVITYGKRQVMTTTLILKQVTEIWAYLDIARYEKNTGLTYNGYKSVDMEKYIYNVGKAPASAHMASLGHKFLRFV